MADEIRTPEEARIQKLEDRQKDMVHKADLRELVERFEEQAEEIDERKRATDAGDAHANGVSCGIRWARDELGEMLDD